MSSLTSYFYTYSYLCYLSYLRWEQAPRIWTQWSEESTPYLYAGEDGCESHLKIVLLGGRNSGKSSVGNIILGGEEFVTRERATCCKRQREVAAGRWVSVVDTPGWWCDFGTRDTAELVKREIAGSVLLCFPGPHVFLVVVKACSPFSEQRRRALEQHVALLGETVWRHCIVLFTCEDAHGVRDERPETRGDSALKWLIEKCSHRFMWKTGDTVGGQVTRLLVKIRKLTIENANRPFEIQPSTLRRINQNIKTVEERALQRFLTMKDHRAQMQEDLHHLSDLRVVVVGAKGSGKTSVVNTILGGRAGRPERMGRTARCEVHRAAVLGRDVTVVDTPGWWMNYLAADSAAFDRREVARGPLLCPPGPQALLLVVRVDRAFTDTHRRAVQEHLELLLGPEAWRHTLLVFSFGDWLGDTSIERYVESEGEPLRWLVERCGNRYHVVYNRSTADAGFQVAELVGKVEEMTRRRQALRAELELRLVLLGGRSTGKSSCGNTILGRADFDADSPTAACVEGRARVRGVDVTVLDTPCWPPPTSHSGDKRPRTPGVVTGGLTALLLVVNVSSSFTSSLREALEEQMDWLGNTSIEERIESEGEALRGLVDRCGNRYHVLDNRHRGDRSQVYQLLDQIEEMLVGARLALLQRGERVRKSVTLAVSHSKQGLKACRSQRKMRADDTLRKLLVAGDLQALIDQWGNSSLEELETFVDAHFQMVWERAMHGSAAADEVTELGAAAATWESEQNAGPSIAEKLSKLDLLEDIQRDLAELKGSLDKCWK
ncbi:hypothetical protein NHX12_032481, partial [Muraenolepis orangiensis]